MKRLTTDTWTIIVKKKPNSKFKDTLYTFTSEKACDEKIYELDFLHKNKGYVYTKSFRRIKKSIDILLDESRNKFSRIQELSLKIDNTYHPEEKSRLFKQMNSLTKIYDKYNGHV